MRTNFITAPLKILTFMAVILIICLLVAIGFKTSRGGKDTISSGIGQINRLNSEHSSIDKSVYDGTTILGSELVNLIKKTIEKEEYLSIVVRTLEGSRTDYNYVFDYEANKITEAGTKSIETSKARFSYINTMAQFSGSAKKDENGNIICLWFEQMN